MSMYISISEKKGLTLTVGIFGIIIESTREQFLEIQQQCMRDIYRTFDDEGQEFIVLRNVHYDCFNIFYQHCEAAMKAFPQSPRGKIPTSDYIPRILWHYEEVLRLMREDPRFDVKLCYSAKTDD